MVSYYFVLALTVVKRRIPLHLSRFSAELFLFAS